jgi:serine incorporator 1/3
VPPDDGTTDAPPSGAALPASRPPPAPLTYSYPFFHAVFAAGSAYLAMLLTGWGTGAAERRLIDVGWPSVAVKLTYAWAALALYSWTLVAPTLLPDRFDF